MHHTLHHQPLMALLSVLLACTGSYVALTLAAQLESVSPSLRRWWRRLTAITAGLTIWVMHFVGMLACQLPVPVTYDLWPTLLSMLVAVGAALLSLLTVIRHEFSGRSVLGSGVMLGLGVAGMHYLGMSAMRGPMTTHYSAGWVLLSVVIAIITGTAALYLLRWDRHPGGLSPARLVAACAMGLAISAMHYTGMKALTVTPDPGAPTQMAHQPEALAYAVTAAAAVIFVLLLVSIQVGRQFTLQGRQRDELRERVGLDEELYWTVINNLTEGVLIIDHEGKLVNCNDSARRIFELPGAEVSIIQQLGNSNFFDEQGKHVALSHLPGNRAIQQQVVITDVLLHLHLPTGTRKWLSMSAKPLPARPGELPGAAVSFTDTTQEHHYAQRLLTQARNDDLTGLPNRRHFQTSMNDAISRAASVPASFALLYLDLDHFKNVNDTLGHTIGDEVLREVARRLRATLPVEAVPFRFGGDEFAVLLPEVSGEQDVQHIAGLIRGRLAQPMRIEGRELHTDASIGYSLYPADGQDPTTLLKHADLALNHIKASGRGGSLRYTSSQGQRRTREVDIERALRSSIGSGQFALAYQPIYLLSSGQVCRCEALLRWTHPELGNVSPAEFIPIAEESGLIGPIGEWVLRKACRQGQRWRQTGHPMPIAVNISMRQFRDGGLPGLIERVLAEHDLHPGDLIVEITESALMNRKDDVAGQLRTIRELGTQISLDDFGTGFSSLQLLHELPIDQLKLDRGFIQSMSDSERQHLLVKNIITLAHGLGLSVIAEGIETPEQGQNLRSYDCEAGQGYLLSRPLKAQAMTALLEQSARGPVFL